MSAWEQSVGASNDWYTPKYIFDTLGCWFDMDVAAPVDGPRYVPATIWYSEDSLSLPWFGFVWMNPPFGGRNEKKPWLDKFFAHGDGIALTSDCTSAPWWQEAAPKASAILFVAGRPRFERPDGSVGKHPGNGVTLMAAGALGKSVLHAAGTRGLGVVL